MQIRMGGKTGERIGLGGEGERTFEHKLFCIYFTMKILYLLNRKILVEGCKQFFHPFRAFNIVSDFHFI